MERLNTDYNGVSSNGSMIACYGNYGIITYTNNYGQIWNQVNIGDKHNIVAVFPRIDEFIAFTTYGIFKSKSNGAIWIQQNIELPNKIISVSEYGKQFFILTQSGVFQIDSNLVLSPQPILPLDEFSNYSGIQCNAEHIFVIQNQRSIIHYHRDLKSTDTTDVIYSLFKNNCIGCSEVADLSIHDSVMFLTIKGRDGDSFARYSISRAKYETLSNSLQPATCYTIQGDKAKFASISTNSVSDYYSMRFEQLDSVFTISVPKKQQWINNDTSKNNFLLEQPELKQIHFINSDTLIAVGSAKYISFSFDAGLTWKTHSLFHIINNDVQPTILNDSLLYYLNSSSYYCSTNAGTTWLPQIVTSPDVLPSQYSGYYYDSLGNGVVFCPTLSKTISNGFVTSDFGKNYKPLLSIDCFRLAGNKGIPRFVNVNKNAIVTDSTLLFIGRLYSEEGNQIRSLPNAYAFRFSKFDYHQLDSIVIPASNVVNVVKVKNSIFALCLNTKGNPITDSAGNSPDYEYHYFIARSTDQGVSWDSVATLPITQSKVKYTGNSYIYIDYSNSQAIVRENTIVYSTYKGDVYLFNTLDSSTTLGKKLQTQIRRNATPFFYKDTLLFPSDYHNLFVNANVITNEWDSVSMSKYLDSWESRGKIDGKDLILHTEMLTDSTGYMTIGEYYPNNFINNVKANVARIKSQSPNVVNTIEHQIEKSDDMLWAFFPYPTPSGSYVQSDVYWNSKYSVDNIKVKVFSVTGQEVTQPNIYIQNANQNRGILKWECHDIPNGIYIIYLTLSNGSFTLPVVIHR